MREIRLADCRLFDGAAFAALYGLRNDLGRADSDFVYYPDSPNDPAAVIVTEADGSRTVVSGTLRVGRARLDGQGRIVRNPDRSPVLDDPPGLPAGALKVTFP